jgi:hypothetical protein
MPWKAVTLPTLTVTTSVTASPSEWLVSDAESVVFKITSATTAPGPLLQGELTDTGATWTNLVAATSGATGMLVFQDCRGVSRIRLATTAAPAAATTVIGAKHIVV